MTMRQSIRTGDRCNWNADAYRNVQNSARPIPHAPRERLTNGRVLAYLAIECATLCALVAAMVFAAGMVRP